LERFLIIKFYFYCVVSTSPSDTESSPDENVLLFLEESKLVVPGEEGFFFPTVFIVSSCVMSKTDGVPPLPPGRILFVK
jgi:hypothetical protein